ncbi:Cytochrome P450 [Dillenia turbinata]|uniref:Cytochrome P450 n=1 Tax=Dillenia turbinata TaxID=194707 RepID=A0AAN8ZN48_9MAGN
MIIRGWLESYHLEHHLFPAPPNSLPPAQEVRKLRPSGLGIEIACTSSLLHTFDWELEKPVTRDVMVVDPMGVSLRKADPLRAIPRKRAKRGPLHDIWPSSPSFPNMEISWSFVLWTALPLALLIHFLWPKRPSNFPPGPPGWPVIGNMLELGKLPHREMVALKEKYGPVIGLRVGKRLNETAAVRRKCVDQMLLQIEDEARNLRPIHVPQLIFYTSFNILGNMMFSRDLLDPSCKDVLGLCKAIIGIIEVSAVPNLADAYPWLGRWDLQGLRRTMNNVLDEAIGFASRFVRERIEERQMRVDQNRPKDFLDVLLDYEGDGKEEPAKFSEHTINIFILVNSISLSGEI